MRSELPKPLPTMRVPLKMPTMNTGDAVNRTSLLQDARHRELHALALSQRNQHALRILDLHHALDVHRLAQDVLVDELLGRLLRPGRGRLRPPAPARPCQAPWSGPRSAPPCLTPSTASPASCQSAWPPPPGSSDQSSRAARPAASPSAGSGT
ncbi:hypothetical protein DL89DRAFT_102393 [Linderina pennispora]|uniref:Uncharacterized protein n=1 Tax=Linderina pennispora TaxID=61395 RepID=A0A1Y1WED8_9FUNG|nr:uncharacterized protein DL89DRAFT_102393 [Linderina pennispora]ORX71853.1 hypothetical protein DL89DRAFT_102393 [Linderina pennispora]